MSKEPGVLCESAEDVVSMGRGRDGDERVKDGGRPDLNGLISPKRVICKLVTYGEAKAKVAMVTVVTTMVC